MSKIRESALLRTILLALPLCLLASCKQPLEPLRVGTNVWPGYEPLYLARHIGLLESERVRLAEYPSSTEVMRAFRSRSLDAASLTLDEALLLVDMGVPIKVVLVHDVSQGADVILARPGIEKVVDLSGRRVAVESGALGAYMITRALQKSAMSIDTIRISHLDVNQHESSYAAGEVDAAVTFEPFSTRLKTLGAQEIFSSRELPDEIIDVLVVHEAVYEQRLEDLKYLTKAWFESLDYLANEPEKSATVIGRRLKLQNDEVLASYELIHLTSLEENAEILQNGQRKLDALAKVMQEHGLVREGLSTNQVMSTHALP